MQFNRVIIKDKPEIELGSCFSEWENKTPDFPFLPFLSTLFNGSNEMLRNERGFEGDSVFAIETLLNVYKGSIDGKEDDGNWGHLLISLKYGDGVLCFLMSEAFTIDFDTLLEKERKYIESLLSFTLKEGLIPLFHNLEEIKKTTNFLV